MDRSTYEKIYSLLDSSNIDSISADFGVGEGVLKCILNQKILRSNKALYHKVANNSEALLGRWKGGESFMSISNDTGLSPVLVSIILLKRDGVSRKGARKMIKNPGDIEDERLRKELLEVVEKDNLFSPRSHSIQVDRARMCEGAIKNWLKGKDVEFLTEEQIKKHVITKTPDFLLKSKLNIDSKDINWIESKGLFGDKEEHRHHSNKQFLEYVNLYGAGMVVYWYGFLDSIAEENSGILVKDSTYFGAEEVEYL
jgi:hypothetical protein